MNKRIDKEIKGRINNFRHMKTTDEARREGRTNQERLDLARKMRHSPVTQLWYVRKHRIG